MQIIPCGTGSVGPNSGVQGERQDLRVSPCGASAIDAEYAPSAIRYFLLAESVVIQAVPSQ